MPIPPRQVAPNTIGVPPPARGRIANHVTTACLALAALLDSATFLALPPGAEANPLAAHSPALAIAAKAAIVVFLLAWRHPYASRVRLFGALAWCGGFLSNALVLWR